MANEKRLIDANALLEILADSRESWAKNLQAIRNWWPHAVGIKDNIIRLIREAPTVDAVEVVHGHNLRDHNSAFECSVCGFEDWDTLTADTSEYNYCPHCGAKMDGGVKNA